MHKLFVALLGAAATLPAATAAQNRIDPLTHMNKMFRAEYKAARAEVIRDAEPIIVVAFDELVLYWKGRRLKQGFTPRLYHEVKAVAHVPLTLYVMLHAHTGRRISLKLEKRLNDLRGRIVAAEKSLAGRPGWTPAILRLHRGILRRAVRLIDSVLARARISRARLNGFARGIAPLLLGSADVAARAQLTNLNALLNRWKKMLGPDWRRVKVANLAPRQAELQNAQGSFVTAYFGRHLLNRRVFMTRNIFSAAGARPPGHDLSGPGCVHRLLQQPVAAGAGPAVGRREKADSANSRETLGRTPGDGKSTILRLNLQTHAWERAPI